MASVLSPINLIVLLAILFVAADCEHHEDGKFSQMPKATHHFGPVVHGRDEPNFLEKISHHLIKGWHGFRGLFGRKSNRRQENGYGHGGYGREEVHKPIEKEVPVNKEYLEPEANKEYPSFGSHRPSAYKVDKDKHSQVHKELGHKEEGKEGEGKEGEGNQEGYQVGVDESFKGDGKKDHKEEKSFGYEEGAIKPFDQRNGDKKGRGFEKRSTDESAMKDSGNEDSAGGPYEEGTDEDRSIDSVDGGDESGSDEHDESHRFKRATHGRRASFRPRSHRFRGVHGRPTNRP